MFKEDEEENQKIMNEIAGRLKIVVKATYENDKGTVMHQYIDPSSGCYINDSSALPMTIDASGTIYKLKDVKIELKSKSVEWR